MNNNLDNLSIGKKFQKRIIDIAEEKFKIPFQEECPMPVGNPAKDHKFDAVSIDKHIIIECKCYSWTNGNNVPSAKMSTLNEAILYMRSLPKGTHKILAMKKDVRQKTFETLATYYCRIYGHLLDDIEVWEVDEDNNVKVMRSASI